MTSFTPVRAALAGGAVAAIAATMIVASSAGASTTSVSATPDHSSVHLGSSLLVRIGVSPSAAGQTVVLQQDVNGQWRNIVQGSLGKSSAVNFKVTPKAGGTAVYRAVYPAQHGRPTTISAARSVGVQTLQQITVADYSERARVWYGPRISIPAANYRVDWTNSCVGPQNGLIIDWNGDNTATSGGFESYYGVDNPARSGTWNGTKGARSGYFSVSAPCHFTLHVSYQGWR